MQKYYFKAARRENIICHENRENSEYRKWHALHKLQMVELGRELIWPDLTCNHVRSVQASYFPTCWCSSSLTLIIKHLLSTYYVANT